MAKIDYKFISATIPGSGVTTPFQSSWIRHWNLSFQFFLNYQQHKVGIFAIYIVYLLPFISFVSSVENAT